MSEHGFLAVLEEMAATYRSKNADYAGDNSTYFNFEYAAAVAKPFVDAAAKHGNYEDVVFAVMLGIKLARLAALKGTGRAPNNEPVSDSHKDLTTYAGIWAAYERVRRDALREG